MLLNAVKDIRPKRQGHSSRFLASPWGSEENRATIAAAHDVDVASAPPDFTLSGMADVLEVRIQSAAAER